jgi:hypothetical protein
MGIAHTILFKNKTLSLSTPIKSGTGGAGFWIYCKIAKQNIAMRAKTEHEAMAEAVEYYQERYVKLLSEHKKAMESVRYFIGSFPEVIDELKNCDCSDY